MIRQVPHLRETQGHVAWLFRSTSHLRSLGDGQLHGFERIFSPWIVSTRGRCMVSFKNQTLRYDSTQETQYNHICYTQPLYGKTCQYQFMASPNKNSPEPNKIEGKQLMKLIQRLMAWGGFWRGDLWVNPLILVINIDYVNSFWEYLVHCTVTKFQEMVWV